MSVPSGQRVGVVFGGPSVEHDVSIITAQQVMAALTARHKPVPLYLARDGRWFTGHALTTIAAFADDPPRGGQPARIVLGERDGFLELPAKSRLRSVERPRIDVIINSIHGTGGEDGSLLGVFELLQVPYVGRGVTASALSMDKAFTKAVLSAAGIAVLDHQLVERSAWEADRSATVTSAIGAGTPCFVKPVSLGSSIGVTRCETRLEIAEALELALELDRYAIVERAAEGATELNVAVIGHPGGRYRASEVEQPLGSQSGLTFEDKYVRSAEGNGAKGAKATAAKAGQTTAAKTGEQGGMTTQDRLIPAPISKGLRNRIQETAISAHRALRYAGIVRYDFFAIGTDADSRIVINEANTVPGSFSSYLFQPMGLAFDDLLDELLAIALAEARQARSTTRTFDSALIGLHTGARS